MTSEVMERRPRRGYIPSMRTAFGPLLKRWRERRRLSQESLADDAEISTRHLSFLESGKSAPSREMVLLLASALDLPLRERNVLLGAAGFAPVYRESALDAATIAPFKRALDLLLAQQEPYGAVVFDRGWNVVQMNQGALRLFSRFAPKSTDPALATNLVRSIFHPDGLRAHIVNWRDVAALTLERLERDALVHFSDESLQALRDEVLAYPDVPTDLRHARFAESSDPFLTVHLRTQGEEVRLFTLLTSLGTPLDVTAQELSIESYFPADEASERFLRSLQT